KSQVIFLRKTGAGVHIRSEEMRLLLSRHEYFGMPLQQPVKRGRAALPPPHDKEIRPAHNVPSKVGWMFSRRRAELASRMLSRTALEPAAMAAPSMSHFGTSAAHKTMFVTALAKIARPASRSWPVMINSSPPG